MTFRTFSDEFDQSRLDGQTPKMNDRIQREAVVDLRSEKEKKKREKGERKKVGAVTKFLAVEIVSLNGENLISEGGSIRFITDCAGGHRAWDFAYNSLDDSFTFAAIQKNSLLFTRQRVERIQSVCGFRRKCLIPSLHGRDINTCLLVPRKISNADEGDLIINCYTGSEEFSLGSFALEIKGSTTSKGMQKHLKILFKIRFFTALHSSNTFSLH
ncbi:hypothetical protein ACTXT7_008918 [Hymenolepis weldensis]